VDFLILPSFRLKLITYLSALNWSEIFGVYASTYVYYDHWYNTYAVGRSAPEGIICQCFIAHMVY